VVGARFGALAALALTLAVSPEAASAGFLRTAPTPGRDASSWSSCASIGPRPNQGRPWSAWPAERAAPTSGSPARRAGGHAAADPAADEAGQAAGRAGGV